MTPPNSAANQVAPVQRRASPRYQCRLRTLGRLGFPEGGEVSSALVHDLSELGISLTLNRALTVGVPLVIRLDGPGRGRDLHLPAWVVHCTPLEGESWRVGCRFESRLDAEMVADLL